MIMSMVTPYSPHPTPQILKSYWCFRLKQWQCYHSSLIWTINLFPSLSSAKQTYPLTFNLYLPVPSCSRVATLDEPVPPITGPLKVTPPPGSLPSPAPPDPRIPGTTTIIRHLLTGVAPCIFLSLSCSLY